MRLLAVLGLVMCVSALAPAAAQEAPPARADRADRIADALGLPGAMKNVQALQVESTRRQIDLVLNELKRNGTSERQLTQVAAWGDAAAQKVADAWEPKEAARIYADALVEQMSDDELAQAEQYFSSPEGKKTYAAIEASMRKMMDYITGKADPVIEAELAGFVGKVQQMQAHADKDKGARKPTAATP